MYRNKKIKWWLFCGRRFLVLCPIFGRGELRVAARLLQRVGTLTTVYDALYLFSMLSIFFFPTIFFNFCRVFAAALYAHTVADVPNTASYFLLGEFFGQQKRPRVRPLRCFRKMCGLIPVSISPLLFLNRVVERWSLCDALTFDLVSDYWLRFFFWFHVVCYLVWCKYNTSCSG